jgi:hypothetical protein
MDEQSSPANRTSKAEVAKVLARAGCPEETIHELLPQLHDPVDPERDAPAFQRYGLSLQTLMDRLGATL